MVRAPTAITSSRPLLDAPRGRTSSSALRNGAVDPAVAAARPSAAPNPKVGVSPPPAAPLALIAPAGASSGGGDPDGADVSASVAGATGTGLRGASGVASPNQSGGGDG